MPDALNDIFSQIPWKPHSNPSQVARHVKKLSDLYISEEGSPEIWDDKALVHAYLNYFLPLNCFRALAVLQKADEVGFLDLIDEVTEFGSGPGTLQLASHFYGKLWKWSCLEASKKAREQHKEQSKAFGFDPPQFLEALPGKNRSLFASSYVMSETELPAVALQYDSILLIEASTQNTARKLMKLRNKLIDNGFSIWGPCTHHEACPLLEKSNKDWCHFRVHFDAPEWFEKLEAELPMKNRTLTFSYLLASKLGSPNFKGQSPARVIGDTLYEKGKVRQALCRGSKKEFLSWLKRHGEPQPYPSGELIQLPESITIKGNELRLNNSDG